MVNKEENMEMEQKKSYMTPKMEEVRLERQVALLDGSPDPDPEYNGPFGLAPQQQNPLA
jgi:hypothetical protein